MFRLGARLGYATQVVLGTSVQSREKLQMDLENQIERSSKIKEKSNCSTEFVFKKPLSRKRTPWSHSPQTLVGLNFTQQKHWFFLLFIFQANEHYQIQALSNVFSKL